VIRLVISGSGTAVCERCQLADSFWTRGRGLLGRSGLDPDEGILLVPGSSIHMFGMKFAIDVIYLTREDVVTDFVENIAPGKAHVAKNGAGKPYSALEVAAGTIARTGVRVGDQLLREAAGSAPA
jgi:hypothetical protein